MISDKVSASAQIGIGIMLIILQSTRYPIGLIELPSRGLRYVGILDDVPAAGWRPDVAGWHFNTCVPD